MDADDIRGGSIENKRRGQRGENLMVRGDSWQKRNGLNNKKIVFWKPREMRTSRSERLAGLSKAAEK